MSTTIKADPRSKNRPHALIAWELGGGLGHLTRIGLIAAGLVAAGYRVSLCLQDLSRVRAFVPLDSVHLYQAPLWLPRLRQQHEPLCYADILRHRGYGSVDGLHALVRSWRDLFATLNPDLLLFDYAPTALLAARDRSQPKVLLSSGFGERSAGFSDLCLRPWIKGSEALTRHSENRVLKVVNRVLDRDGLAPISCVADIYQADRMFLFLLPEIDLETDRDFGTYLPPPEGIAALPILDWNDGTRKRVLAYLKPESKRTSMILQAMTDLGCAGQVVCPGLPESMADRYRSSHLTIHTQPHDLRAAITGADVVVCHAGKNTISNALLAGKPLLLLPEQLEQWHNSRRVEEHGAGLMLAAGADVATCRDQLKSLLEDPEYRTAASQIANRRAEMTRIDPVATVVRCCEELFELRGAKNQQLDDKTYEAYN